MEENELLPHILVVDDDDRLRDLLRRYLSENGFIVTPAKDAQDACRKLESLMFDIIVLDIMMPGENGLELSKRLQTHTQPPPILLLTAMGEPEDRIHGLESGADDYLTKPFEPRELVLRINAILRRSRKTPPHITPVSSDIRFGPYRFDIGRCQLLKGNETVYLTSQEQDILTLLARKGGEAVSRETLAKAGGVIASERSVDVQINRLRKKLGDTPGKPLYIQTVRGSGYILRVD